MGCTTSKPANESIKAPDPEQKIHSFAARKIGLKKEDYMFKDKDGEVLTRDPGKINGQQFIIENCKNCKIFLRDHSAAINMDNCENCELFLGPCLGSIYLRNSKSCKVILATAQLRMYNCVDFEMLVFSITDPSIENCSKLKIGCFDYS